MSDKHPLIKAAEEARRIAGRGVYYCSDCDQDTLVSDDIRCTACGSGRVVAGFSTTQK